MARDRRPRIPGDQILDAQQIARLLADELPAFAQQVTELSFFLWIDIPPGQNVQPQEMG
jgi:hypothetical protein